MLEIDCFALMSFLFFSLIRFEIYLLIPLTPFDARRSDLTLTFDCVSLLVPFVRGYFVIVVFMRPILTSGSFSFWTGLVIYGKVISSSTETRSELTIFLAAPVEFGI